MQIYLDYSATTPPRSEVIAKIQTVMTQEWGNPSSLHSWGGRSATRLEVARMQVAALIGAKDPDSLVFTSGGTEADNLAVMGVTRQYETPQHLITSSVEHPAIAQPIDLLEQQGWQITRLSVNRQGRVNPLDLQAAIQPNTVLISIIYGQSEVGTIQPIAELAQIAHNANILFHTDAVQVAGRIPLNVQNLPIDLLSLSSHKIYGTQGVGALYIRPGVELSPLIVGGGQERNIRSGTQAVPLIAGFGEAAELAQTEMVTENERLIGLRDRAFDLLSASVHLQPTGDPLHRLPHHLSFAIQDPRHTITGKTLVRQMNLAGIAISAGSACHSGKLSPSPILTAMGYPANQALAGIRLTLGRDTTTADIDWTAIVLQQILDRLLTKELASSF